MIRKVIKDDFGQLVEIYNQAILKGHQTAHLNPVTIDSRKQWFLDHAAKRQLLLAYLEGKTILGYLSLSAYRNGREALQGTKEVSIYIRQDSQNQGIASALFKHTLALCPSMGIEALIAIILASNQSSISFFKKHQFEEWGRLLDIAKVAGHKIDHVYLGRQVSLDKR
ncbi:MAG: GNAT family N-acetyltransferase [Candidatus Marinimicrobia bacterium]|nr:GNAT family N-acetyltransferase [Candidatus Neomarinimicrobiota bacterium]MCF7850284.1 GNAT family N-acetyltransferase [Candidatus Neomarinimicrobiota bacterium]MCF7903819.1 GNAT family N-acetyltransferase [Candidatus Neomarinimicrobiota bacterium]